MLFQPLSYRKVVKLERKVSGGERCHKHQQGNRPCLLEGVIVAEHILHIKEDVAVVGNVEWKGDFAEEGTDLRGTLAGQWASCSDIDDEWEE